MYQVCRLQRGAVAGRAVCPCAIPAFLGSSFPSVELLQSCYLRTLTAGDQVWLFLTWQKTLHRSVELTCRETGRAGEEFLHGFKDKLEHGWSCGVCSAALWLTACYSQWHWSLNALRQGSHTVCDHRALVCHTVMGFTKPEDLTPSENVQNKHHEIFTAFCTMSLSHLKTCQNSDIAESVESALHLSYLQSL